MPVTIDIDVKVERIQVEPLVEGMKATFELRDEANLETRLYLTFYKKQIDYIMQQFYKVDKEKIREELRMEFEEREFEKEEDVKEDQKKAQTLYNVLDREYQKLIKAHASLIAAQDEDPDA